MFKYALYIYAIKFHADILCIKFIKSFPKERQLRQMPSHHRVSYNSDSSLRPNEDNLLLILKLVYYNKKFYSCVFICYLSVLQRHSVTKNNVTNWKKPSRGPKGLRSLGSPVMSRLLYQAELWALRKSKLTCAIK